MYIYRYTRVELCINQICGINKRGKSYGIDLIYLGYDDGLDWSIYFLKIFEFNFNINKLMYIYMKVYMLYGRFDKCK